MRKKVSCPFCDSRKTRLQYEVPYFPYESRYVCDSCLRNWNQAQIRRAKKLSLLDKVVEQQKRVLNEG